MWNEVIGAAVFFGPKYGVSHCGIARYFPLAADLSRTPEGDTVVPKAQVYFIYQSKWTNINTFRGKKAAENTVCIREL